MKREIGVLLCPTEDGSAAADLDVVCVSSQAEHGAKTSRGELNHNGSEDLTEATPDRQKELVGCPTNGTDATWPSRREARGVLAGMAAARIIECYASDAWNVRPLFPS